ncbi:MAG: hypothetical protein NZM40_00425 [Sphingomonadaceae bacterium]|uniref:glycerophosphodiester phosphodiesterase family protein n=1 Tax=Thermaurantiacus sp. TaxID=2820283 RepID=UPI00298EDA2D|nr:glycerophosphodiester phosphodiesterase family protein [Thermaurantiacus sp.]MCS6985906.1 hypothetical protein [Sphingomonadaceae bacterium]MDW8414878.1 glycerophosphodiester phosphodiesterase family protein [Thermaurantiacus sp.]
MFLQSFEVGNLERLAGLTRIPLVQLVAARGGPPDRPSLSSAHLLSDQGLKRVRQYASAIGVEKTLVIPRTPDERLGRPTDLVARAQAVGLAVHAWTFRPENFFLPRELRRGAQAEARGDAEGELRAYLAAGVDGVFTDWVPPALAARRARVTAAD